MIVGVEVEHVEARDVGEDQLHQANVVGQRLPAFAVLPQRARTAGDELARAVLESPLAKSVTSCPSRTSSSVR